MPSTGITISADDFEVPPPGWTTVGGDYWGGTDDGRWHGPPRGVGLNVGKDHRAEGQGFAHRFGDFEMRARWPKGLGTWPAFWLMGVPQRVEPKDKKTIRQIEIDLVEQREVGPNAPDTTLHR